MTGIMQKIRCNENIKYERIRSETAEWGVFASKHKEVRRELRRLIYEGNTVCTERVSGQQNRKIFEAETAFLEASVAEAVAAG